MDTLFTAYWLFLLVGLFIDVTSGLQCWHCIADNCDLNPSENYKASKKHCQPKQCCQKVIFEMLSTTGNKVYTSTIRSCAGQCDSHDDFENCTYEQYTTRGCVTKTCCANQDLCNTAPTAIRNAHSLVTTCVILAAASIIHAAVTRR